MVVGAVDDPAEREADRLADLLVSDLRRSPAETITPVPFNGAGTWGRVRPASSMHRVARSSVLDDPVAGGPLDEATAGRIRSRSGRGEPLPEAMRSTMEQTTGVSLDGVRVHRDAEAAALNDAVSARAFTAGSDIFFGAGQYDPGSAAGQRLISHEVGHTVQSAVSSADVGRRVRRRESASLADTSGVLRREYNRYGGADSGEASHYEYSTSSSEYSSGGASNYNTGPGNLPGASNYNTAPGNLPGASHYNTAPGNLPGASNYNTAPGNLPGASHYTAYVSGMNDNAGGGGGGYAGNYDSSESSSEEEERGPKYLKTVPSGVDASEATNSPVLALMVSQIRGALAKGTDPEKVKRDNCAKLNWTEAEYDKYVKPKSDGSDEIGKVKFLDETEREPFELKGGSVLERSEEAGPKAFDTSGMRTNQAGAGFGIFVMDNEGRIYSDAHKVGLFHHSSFLSGGEVAAAGEIKVAAGKVQWVTSKTGHYKSAEPEMEQFLLELKSRGQDLDAINVTGFQKAPHLMVATTANELLATGQFGPVK